MIPTKNVFILSCRDGMTPFRDGELRHEIHCHGFDELHTSTTPTPYGPRCVLHFTERFTPSNRGIRDPHIRLRLDSLVRQLRGRGFDGVRVQRGMSGVKDKGA